MVAFGSVRGLSAGDVLRVDTPTAGDDYWTRGSNASLTYTVTSVTNVTATVREIRLVGSHIANFAQAIRDLTKKQPQPVIPYSGKLPPRGHRLDGARNSFHQMSRLPCYRGRRTR